MDLRLYYQKIRDAEAKIADEFPVVLSRETGDGGKEGTLTEVPRRIAAKMVVEGMAEVASLVQKQAFLNAQAEAKRVCDQLTAASQVHLTVLSTSDLDKLKNARPAAMK
jgi:uncharacterized protein with beta-barrel porin domain